MSPYLFRVGARGLFIIVLAAPLACSERSPVSSGSRTVAGTPAHLEYKCIAALPAARGVPLPVKRQCRDIYSVHRLVYSPDGKRLASGCGDYGRTSNTPGRVTLWDPATGQALAKFDGYRTPIETLAFAPDGLTLASGSADPKIDLQDLRKAGGHRRLKVDISPGALVFAADGKRLAVSNLGFVDWYDLANGKRVGRWRMRGPVADVGGIPSTVVCALALTGDGQTLAAADIDGICCWSVATGRVVAVAGRDGLAPGGGISALAFSPDGKTLASDGAVDGGLLLWHARPPVKAGRGPMRSLSSSLIAFSPDGRWLAWGASDEIRVWDMESGSLCRRWQSTGQTVSAVAFSPDGKTLATADYDRTITLWDATALPAPLAARPTDHQPLLSANLGRIAPPSRTSACGVLFQSTREPRTQW